MNDNELKAGLLSNFIGSLERLIEKPPYLIFVFIGAIFVIVSMVTRYNNKEAWIFFSYGVAGMIWRYAEKDLISPLKKHPNHKLYIRTIYHIGNIALFFFAIHYLNVF